MSSIRKNFITPKLQKQLVRSAKNNLDVICSIEGFYLLRKLSRLFDIRRSRRSISYLANR